LRQVVIYHGIRANLVMPCGLGAMQHNVGLDKGFKNLKWRNFQIVWI